MKFTSSVLAACLCCAYSALAQTETVVSTDVVTSVETSTSVQTSVGTVTADATLTVTVTGTDIPETFTVGGTNTQTVVVTESSTAIVTESADVVVTVTAPTVTQIVTETGSVPAVTEFTTMSGTATVTVTSFSGMATINSCIPTTTIVVTTTTAVPTPTSPVSGNVVYVKSDCKSVVCPAGRKTIYQSGSAKRCTLTYSGSTLISSTCVVDYCCTSTSSGSSPVIRSTNCKAAHVQCPVGCTLLMDSNEACVPCLQYYKYNKLYNTSCNVATCCTAPVTTKPVEAEKCSKVVKCSVYNKDPATNYILKCTGTQCTTAYCCRKL